MKITKDDLLCDIVDRHPETIPIFMMHGLFSLDTAIETDTIEYVAACWDADLDSLLEMLNQFV